MNLTQLTALVGLVAIVWAFVLIYGSLRRGERPSDDAKMLVGVWMVMSLALQLVALVG